MVFTSAAVIQQSWGNARVVIGAFVNTIGTTGGNIETGLRQVMFFKTQYVGVAVVAAEPVANTTFPTTSTQHGVIPLVLANGNLGGFWIAIGDQ